MVAVGPGSLASTPLPHPVTFDLLPELGSRNRLYKPHSAIEDARAQRAAPGRAEFLELALRRAPVRRKFRHSNVGEPCIFCAHELTLAGTNSMSNKFSQTPRANQNHQHISKNKLTSGYRKRLSGSRAIKQDVIFFPGFLFVILTASTPRLKNSIA